MSDSVQSRSEGILRDTVDNTSIYPHKKGMSRLEDLLIELLEEGGGGGGSSTAYATALSLTINPANFVMTAQLLNKNGDPLGTAQTIDLPLESVVVNGAYDAQTKKVILTLQNGNTIEFSVADLVDGLQSEITSANKLSADLVDDTNSTNKFVTSADKTTWNGKQDAISDLATIRSNASTGAEAAEVVQGIDETANNYIELKSGQREYLDTTVPIGNIPLGSIGMGFDEGTWTYNSGTKVSKGEPTANLFNEIYPTEPSSTNAYLPIYVGNKTVTLSTNTPYHQSQYCCLFLLAGNVDSGASSSTNGVALNSPRTVDAIDGYITIGYRRYESIDPRNYWVMLNEGSTPLPYEPYGAKKFPFYANGQNLTNYTIYGNDGGVGDEIVNYFDKSVEPIYATTELYRLPISGFDTTKTYTCSTNYEHVKGVSLASIAFNNDKSSISSSRDGVWAGETQSRTPDSDGNLYVYIRYVANGGAEAVYDDVISGTIWVMINEGTTSEPYNKYKLPIICGNTTTNIYLDSPLGANDSIDYTTSQVAIPTVDGLNNLICNTTVQPSKVSLTYTGWHSDLDEATARIEALENAPAPSGGMVYDTLYEGTTASSYPYPLSHPITDYKFIIVVVGYSNVYTSTVVPVAVWNTITGGGNNYVITVDTAKLTVNADNIAPTNSNNRIVYGVYGIK